MAPNIESLWRKEETDACGHAPMISNITDKQQVRSLGFILN